MLGYKCTLCGFFRADAVLQQKQIKVLSGMHPLLVQKSLSTHKLRV